MKKATAVLLFLTILSIPRLALSQALVGSGKTIQKKFVNTDFNSLKFEDLDGEILVQTGKSYSVSVVVDDNLAKLLEVNQREKVLEMKFLGNRDNKLYVEKTNIKIMITMPDLLSLSHRGNSNVNVTGVRSAALKANNSGNGSLTLTGQVSNLDIVKSGNGNILAQNLMAEKVKVRSSGNGNISLNAAEEFLVVATGNGYVRNYGKAQSAKNSIQSGNAKILDSAILSRAALAKIPTNKGVIKPRVYSKIQNITAWAVRFRVMYYPGGTYGFTINPGETHTEYFPVGTKLLRKGKREPIEITEANQDKLFLIE